MRLRKRRRTQLDYLLPNTRPHTLPERQSEGDPLRNYRFALWVTFPDGPRQVPLMSITGLRPGDATLYLSGAAHVIGRSHPIEAWYHSGELPWTLSVRDQFSDKAHMSFEGTGKVVELFFGHLDAGANEVFMVHATVETSVSQRHEEN